MAPALAHAPRVALVTGGSHGIGLETARGLARAGLHVVLASRAGARLDAAREALLAERPDARVEARPLDLASFADVRRFCDGFLAAHDALHVLVNNAGVYAGRREETVDGHERTWQVNHLAHFLLAARLVDTLRRGAPARVVTVASEMHRYGAMRWDDLDRAEGWSPTAAYNQSKLANVLFARGLAKRLEGAGVTSNAVHPGAVATGWATGEDVGLMRRLVRVARPFMLSPEKGARTSLHVALSDEAADVTGAYFVRRRVFPPSRAARDDANVERLWRASQDATGVRF